MKVLIVGAGAVGWTLGWALSKDYEVGILGRPEKGISLARSIIPPVFMGNGPRPMGWDHLGKYHGSDLEAVILAPKAYDLTAALQELEMSIARFGLTPRKIAVASNGIGFTDKAKLERMAVYFGAHLDGEDREGRLAGIKLARSEPPFGKIAHSFESPVFETLRECGFTVELEKSVEKIEWQKAIVNIGVNAVAALAEPGGAPNGVLLDRPELGLRAEGLVKEALNVAKALGVGLVEEQVLHELWETVQATKDNKNSLIRDLYLGGKITEIPWLNGMVCRLGQGVGVATPLNQSICQEVELMLDRSRG